MLAVLLGLVYCCISPIMCPIVLIYFCVLSVLQKYVAIYVERGEYESGGQLWWILHGQVGSDPARPRE